MLAYVQPTPASFTFLPSRSLTQRRTNSKPAERFL
jgi:hypothetical protein